MTYNFFVPKESNRDFKILIIVIVAIIFCSVIYFILWNCKEDKKRRKIEIKLDTLEDRTPDYVEIIPTNSSMIEVSTSKKAKIEHV